MIQPTTSVAESIEARMTRELHKGITERFEQIREQIVADAKQKFENELRAALGNVAINLASYYSVERIGGDLRITVKLEDKR